MHPPTGTTLVADTRRTDRPRTEDTRPMPTTAPSSRLAELVVHLTECRPTLAVAAVNAASAAEPATDDDRLAIVARAMVSVRRSIDLREPKPAR